MIAAMASSPRRSQHQRHSVAVLTAAGYVPANYGLHPPLAEPVAFDTSITVVCILLHVLVVQQLMLIYEQPNWGQYCVEKFVTGTRHFRSFLSELHGVIKTKHQETMALLRDKYGGDALKDAMDEFLQQTRESFDHLSKHMELKRD
jgi:hypothetical protein